MFLELTEHLKCPGDHREEYLVVATGAMKERAIVFGTIGCPVCKAEFLVVNRVARFGEPEISAASGALPLGAEAVQALLGLASPGGFVVLVGSGAALAGELAGLMEGVHFVGINAPESIVAAPFLSLLVGRSVIPLKEAMARGVVIGAEHATEPWLAEGARVLLRGQRLVVLSEAVPPAGIEEMAVGQGTWVGRKP